MQGHEYYEELCALLPIGQLSADEYYELTDHLKGCASCRHATDDFSVILDKMPVGEADVDEKTLVALQGNSYRTRFLERAVSEGVPFSDAVLRSRFSIARWSWPRIKFVPSLAMAASIASVVLAVQVIKLSKQARADGQKVVQIVKVTEPVTGRQNAQRFADLQVQVGGLLDDEIRQQATIASLKMKLSDSRAEFLSSKRDLSNATEQLAQLERQASDNQRALDFAKAELARNRSEKDSVDVSLVEQQAKITELSGEVREKEALAERERQLNSVAKDVRELMGARNLHILDVSDVDGRGRSKKSIGRVFLVENKSLVFYAFDLSDRGNPAKVSFQAWGQAEGRDVVAKNLGVFYIDDHVQKRWVLKVNDPQKLSSINSVFVTVEPLGGTDRPTGKKLLYAYLGTQANHP